MAEVFPIGTLSRRAGVKVPTIRYYEEIGLIATPPRSQGGRRMYGEADVRRLNFIRHSRDMGFEVEAIRRLIKAASDPAAPCGEADSIARAHLSDIDRRIAELTALRAELSAMIGDCHHGKVCECRVIEVLGDHGHCHGEHHLDAADKALPVG